MEAQELKARAYDLVVMQEKIQMELRQINQKLVEIQNTQTEEPQK